MKDYYKLLIAVLIILIFLFSIGLNVYFMVRPNPEPQTEIKYIKGDTIKDSIPIPVPDIKYKDTIIYVELPPRIIYVDSSNVIGIDTAELIKDYIATRNYVSDLFDNDTVGKLTVDIDVQYNELKRMDYTFVPMYKSVTNTVYKPYNWQVNATYFYLPKTHGFTVGVIRNFNRISINGGLMIVPTSDFKLGAYGGVGVNF